MATAEKRTKANGSVYYMLRSSKGSDYYGRRIRYSKKWEPPGGLSASALKRELERQKFLFDEEISHTRHLDGSKLPFGDFFALWLKEYASTQLSPATVALYRGYEPTVTARLGHIIIAELSAHDLQNFYLGLLNKGSVNSKRGAIAKKELLQLLSAKGITKTALKNKSELSYHTVSKAINGCTIKKESAAKIAAAFNTDVDKLFKVYNCNAGLDPATIKRYHSMLSSVLQTAVDWEIIKDNPAKRAKPPKDIEKEARYLTDEEAIKLISALNDAPIKWRTICLLMLYGGFRRGEVAALEWGNIDFNRNTITVRHTAQYVRGIGLITKDPKTHKSQRRITMPKAAMDVLREYKAWQARQRLRLGSKWANFIYVRNERGQISKQKNERLFTDPCGYLLDPSSITRWVAKFRSKHNLPEFSPHSLRHTNVSLMLASGQPVQVVSERVGHSSAAVTLNTYAHLIPSVDQAAADSIEQMLTPEKSQSKAQ